MTIDVHPFARVHPAQVRGRTEGASRLLADDAALPERISDLDEIPGDLELHTERSEEVEELTRYDVDDVDPDRRDPEVEDTPGDDATIAAARIERFDDAHGRQSPVDVGPFVEKDRVVREK